MEPADAKELIDEAIEETERANKTDQALEKKFRNRVSILVGLFAVLLAIIHVEAAGSARESVLKTVEASDNYAYMEAKIIRETVVKTAAQNPALDSQGRTDMLKEATRLRSSDAAGHGITQLQTKADDLRKEGESSSKKGEWYELAETAMQVAIVLLSIALVARSWAIVTGAVSLAAVGIVLALATASGVIL
jgi:hypothetical protein